MICFGVDGERIHFISTHLHSLAASDEHEDNNVDNSDKSEGRRSYLGELQEVKYGGWFTYPHRRRGKGRGRKLAALTLRSFLEYALRR